MYSVGVYTQNQVVVPVVVLKMAKYNHHNTSSHFPVPAGAGACSREEDDD